MKMHKPFTYVEDGRGQLEYQTFSTYPELKKAIPDLIKQAYDGIVHVTRCRRGNWGQWYEQWDHTGIVNRTWL